MKKMLLISYYFPPCGGAPVRRWMRILPLLIEHQWDITVICPQDGDYPQYDESLLSQLPQELKIIRTHSPSIGRFWKMLSPKGKKMPYGELSSFSQGTMWNKAILWMRLNFVIPDIRIMWNPYAYNAAKRELLRDKYDLVITSAPPQSTHLVGLRLKQRLGIRWIADFRDPWTKIHYLQLHKPLLVSRLIHSFLERKVLRKADKSLIVSSHISDELPTGNKILLYNGFDQSDYEGLIYQRSGKFRIKYIGHLTSGQDIKPLMRIFAEMTDMRDMELSLIGTNPADDVLAMAKSLDTPLGLRIIDFLPHREATAEMVNAEMLLLIINNTPNNLGILTTKLFEYIGAKTPILCIGPENGEAASIIHKYHAGKCVDYHKSTELQSFVSKLYKDWKAGLELRNQHDVSKLSIQYQIAELEQHLSN